MPETSACNPDISVKPPVAGRACWHPSSHFSREIIMTSAISSVGSSAYTPPQRPNAAKLASDLFAKLDPTNQGFIDKASLQSAIEGTAPAGGSASGANADAIFTKLDGNQDGKITKQEFTAGAKETAKSAPAGGAHSAEGSRPPPVGGGGGGGGGAAAASSSTSKVYEAADSNKDGTVSLQELLAYQAKQSTTSTTGSSSSSTSASASASSGTNARTSADSSSSQQDSNASILKTILHLAQTYGQVNDSQNSGTNGISATA
jgi:Ca2+-binding EF-hand superfamily protein